MKRAPRSLVAFCILALASINLQGTTIDFDGMVLPPGGTTVFSAEVFGDFKLEPIAVPGSGGHLHYIDPQPYTSEILHDSNYVLNHADGFRVSRSDAAGFSLNSFDAANWSIFGDPLSYTLVVTGYYVNGGSISQSFDSVTTRYFQTFALGAGWSNLRYVDFTDNSVQLIHSLGDVGYDNIVVNATSLPVPDEGTTAGLFALALASFVAVRRLFVG